MRRRVEEARGIQRERWASQGDQCNAELPEGLVRRSLRLSPEVRPFLAEVLGRLRLSGRGLSRIPEGGPHRGGPGGVLVGGGSPRGGGPGLSGGGGIVDRSLKAALLLNASFEGRAGRALDRCGSGRDGIRGT